MGRIEHEDVRERTVENLMQRFDVDRSQVARVRAMAAGFLEQIAGDWHLATEEDMHLLQWAAALHEIGNTVSHSQYHKHGAYLVEHGDLAGFSTQDQERIALLILGQRGNLKKIASMLDDPARTTKVLALRLAVILCHARREVQLPRWSLRAGESAIELDLDGAWLSRHPLTEYLLQEEAAQWEKVGVQFSVRTL
jgi:exopolyphosphatase/guanosine-5'-triphosphate,3'-diphosphate pyrophosphatase